MKISCIPCTLQLVYVHCGQGTTTFSKCWARWAHWGGGRPGRLPRGRSFYSRHFHTTFRQLPLPRSAASQGSRIRSVRILFFEGYVHTLTYSILVYAYPRAMPPAVLLLPTMYHFFPLQRSKICAKVSELRTLVEYRFLGSDTATIYFRSIFSKPSRAERLLNTDGLAVRHEGRRRRN